MTGVPPTVSLGLAVFNGERYLAQAIESILSQTLSDFELIISDNASTDSTESICRSYAARDARIRYSRNSANIGGARNENRTVSLARGRYFRWAAHDDYLEPELLERCVSVLEGDPSVVLCYTQVVIHYEGQDETELVSREHATSGGPARRFARILLSSHLLEETYGVMRLDALRSTRLQADYVNSDRTLMAEMSLYGRFHEIPEALFHKRWHRGNVYIDWRTRISWFRPDLSGSLSFPWWAQLVDLISTVWRVKVAAVVRAQCLAVVGLWCVVRSPNLLKDLVVGGYRLLRGRQWRTERAHRTTNWI